MKPIDFNAKMVQAILDGRKTVLRQCIKFPVFFDILACDDECMYFKHKHVSSHNKVKKI